MPYDFVGTSQIERNNAEGRSKVPFLVPANRFAKLSLPVCVDLLREVISRQGLYRLNERRVDQMLAQEPDLKLIRA